VKALQGTTQIWMTGIMSAAALMTALPASAAAQVTAVQLNPTASGVTILLQTKGGDRPQVFSVNRGNSWTADIVNTNLQIPGGSFKKANPAPGIAMVTVAPLDRGSVRVTVTGQGNAAPTGQVVRGDGSLTLSLNSVSGKQAANPSAKPINRSTEQATSLPALPPPVVAAPPAASQKLPLVTPPLATGNTAAPVTIAQSAPASPLAPFRGAPLVPNPNVTIDGRVYTPPAPVPPNAPIPQPRAIAPPVGDIAVGQTDASPSLVDLGTSDRVPRLVLRDASSREVLSLLARAARLNLVFVDSQTGLPGQPPPPPGQPGAGAGDGPKVTLDIENEPIQNVFNYVLQITGLEANRRGNTISVGTRLPTSARNIVMRSIRLNQMPVTGALNALVALGAESAISRERLVTSVNAVPIQQITGGAAGSSAITQTQTTTEQRIETQRINYSDSTPIFRGLAVSGDERTNTLTLVGEPRKVDMAIAQLTQLDLRRRQVAVNVRVIDVNLLAFDRAGASFSFGINDTQVSSTGGLATINFGSKSPSFVGTETPLNPSGLLGSAPTAFNNFVGAASGFANRFLLQLQAAVTSGNAKVLTDPTLVVQEGQTANVDLTQEVITNIRQQSTLSAGSAQVTVTVEKEPAGLTLPVKVDKIDDNGFISLSVAPLITRPEREIIIQFTSVNGGGTVGNPITLLSRRKVESGQVRLRDGQTLVLSGIIQDQDRSTSTKVPILGDIPILGALFRRVERQNERREVIVLLTPRILDDGDRSAFGYSYSPGPEIKRILENSQPGGGR
jgi:type IV pilus assembly protein PilQ